MTDINAILDERGSRYGTFEGHANFTQNLKSFFQNHPKWVQMTADEREAIDMIAHKLGRIFNGDPHYADSWVDIGGYSKLVADRLEGVVR